LHDERAAVGAAIFLALALGHVLILEAPPNALADGLDHPASGLVGLVVIVVATVFMARFGRSSIVTQELLGGLAAATAVYLASFVALGLLLIGCAFAYQSLRREGQS